MSKQREFIIEVAGSISDVSYSTNFSLAIDLELEQIEKIVIGFILFKDEFIDILLLKDQFSSKNLTIEKHEKFDSSVRKGKLQARSILSKFDDKNCRLLITKNDLDCIISWYLLGFIDVTHRRGVLDIECEETNMLMFATKTND